MHGRIEVVAILPHAGGRSSERHPRVCFRFPLVMLAVEQLRRSAPNCREVLGKLMATWFQLPRSVALSRGLNPRSADLAPPPQEHTNLKELFRHIGHTAAQRFKC